MSTQQRKAFEAYILETKVPALIEKCGGDLSESAATTIIKATWLDYVFGTDEFKAPAAVEMFELWKAAQAAVVVELPQRFYMQAGDGPGVYPQAEPDGEWVESAAVVTVIIAAGGTVKS